MDNTKFISQHLHFFLNQTENKYLFIFIELTIATLIENFKEFIWRLYSQKIINLKEKDKYEKYEYLPIICNFQKSILYSFHLKLLLFGNQPF